MSGVVRNKRRRTIRGRTEGGGRGKGNVLCMMVLAVSRTLGVHFSSTSVYMCEYVIRLAVGLNYEGDDK